MQPQYIQVTLEIPDFLAESLTASGKDPARAILEAFAQEGDRNRTLFEEDLRRLLGFESRFQVHDFLAQREIPLNYSVEDYERDVQTLERLKAREISRAA